MHESIDCHPAMALTLHHLRKVADIGRLADAAEVWKLRAKYAAIRPTGWRSAPGHAVSWR